MSAAIPFYVREFNAASMGEAIHLADHALREDGVTVAVWKNFAQSFGDDIQRQRKKLLHDFMNEAESCIGKGSISRYNDSFQAVQNGVNIYLPELFAQITIADKPQYSVSQISQDFLVHRSQFIYPEMYRGLALSSLMSWQPPSCTITSWLSYELGYTRNEDIHVDSVIDNQNTNNSLLFLGQSVRVITNLSGTPTEFFSNEQGDDVYTLPAGSLSIHKSSDPVQKAWHRAKPCAGKPRVVSVMNLEFRNEIG